MAREIIHTTILDLADGMHFYLPVTHNSTLKPWEAHITDLQNSDSFTSITYAACLILVE